MDIDGSLDRSNATYGWFVSTTHMFLLDVFFKFYSKIRLEDGSCFHFYELVFADAKLEPKNFLK